MHAEQVELLGDAQLVVDGRRDALDLEAVAQCGVEDLDVSWGMKCSRELKEPPGGRLDEHVGAHVFYRMMMMAATGWFVIGPH